MSYIFLFTGKDNTMSTTSQYLVDNAMILSSKLKYKGALTAAQTVTLPEEQCSQFGNIQVSAIFTGAINPVTINVYATNDTTASPQWDLVATKIPAVAVNVYSINLAYRRIYVSIVNGALANTINLIALYATAPLPPDEQFPDSKTIDAAITNADLLALGRNIPMGRGRIIGSDVRNTTLSSDSSLRVTQGSKMYSFDDADRLVQQSKLIIKANRVITKATAPATSVLVAGKSITQTGGAGVGASTVSFNAPVVDDSSIVVIRGSGSFTAGTGYTRTSFGGIGIGTNVADFGFWYNTAGEFASVVVNIIAANDAVPTIDVVLNGITYSCNVPPPHPDYKIGCAAGIVTAFNALGAPWIARQAGNTVIFTSTAFGVAGTTSITSTDVVFDATITTVTAGALGVWTHIPTSAFNINRLTTWLSGDYVEYELSMMNGGRNVKLAIVDKDTQDLVDVLTFTSTVQFATIGSYPITIDAFDAGAVNVAYTATISTIKNTGPKKPVLSSIINANNVFAYGGNTAFPVVFINKKSSSKYQAVIRKIVVVADQPTRVSVVVNTGSTIGGEYLITATETNDNTDTYISSYTQTLDPLNFDYTAGANVTIDNISNNGEIDINLPIDITAPVSIGLCTNDFVPTIASMMIIIDHY